MRILSEIDADLVLFFYITIEILVPRPLWTARRFVQI